MKQPRLSRRQFFQVSAFGAGTLALPALGVASVATAPTREAQAAAEQPLGPDIPQPTFNPIASNTTFGALTDISMGWDGTLWGIDAGGAPHVYDSINDVWQQHGDGIDAAAIAMVSSTQHILYVFQGSNVVAIDPSTLKVSASTTIAALWPDLPDSFKLGVTGAATNPEGPGLILFNGGRYLSTDGKIPLSKLTDLTNWPQTPIWKDGVIDGVISYGGTILMRAGEVLAIDVVKKSVPGNPIPFSQLIGSLPIPPSWKTSGVDAWTITPDPTNHYILVFKGTAVFLYNPSVVGPNGAFAYLGSAFGNWPATWHPTLQHAPNGRDGNLWSVVTSAQGNWVMQHNGDQWTQLPNTADHAGVGQDNAVMIASAQRLWTVKPNSDNTGYNVTPVSQANNLIQVSLGNANTVNARDSNNNVYSFDPGSGTLTPNTAVGTALHIATTNDGTLWHAKPNDSNMHRLMTTSGTPSQAIAVKQTLVTAVTKVAATGFGASHCLAQDNTGTTQAYRYDSPYLFKSPQDYYTTFYNGGQMAQGLGNLYFGNFFTNQLVALDNHTGVELSRSAPASTYVYYLYTNPVVDTVNELVYVATYLNYSNTDPTPFGDVTTPMQVLALNARDLSKVVWTFTTAASVNVAPSLVGTTLLFGDRAGNIYAIDTTAAAQAAAKNTGSGPIGVSAKATWKLNQLLGTPNVPSSPGNPIPQGGFATFAPAIRYDGQYFLSLCLTYNYTPGMPFYVLYFYSVLLDPATQGQATYDAVSYYTSSQQYNPLSQPPWWNQNTPPIARTLSIPLPGLNETVAIPMIYLACDDAVVQLSPAPNNTFGTITLYTLPVGSAIQGGLALDASAGSNNVTLWFGDQNGYLHGIDNNGTPQPHTPVLIAPNSRIAATPLPYTDPRGNKTVFVGAMQRLDDGYLYGFDPVSGNTASMETGTLQITLMTPAVKHGVLYVAGLYLAADNVPKRTQVMGIRVETITQGQRDFIIESQLMQDPDQNATGGTADADNPIPPSVARYQTNLSLVDDQKNPLPNEAVKIWADAANTVITAGGKQYTIGPDDAAFASVTAGVDGSLVIVSDAKDVNASGLRVWAPFMNPYERIVVYPDNEWHNRASNSYDNPSADPNTAPDPTKPNLSTVHSYSPDPSTPGSTAPKQLFTSDEKSQGTPGNVANAIGQMRAGLNPGGSSAASVAGPLKTLHASNPAAPYIAYTTLPGMHYGPNNARAKRTATIAAPFGFVLNKPQGGAHTFTPLSHSDARSQIDALTGVAWDPNNPNGTPTGAAAEAKPLTFVIRRSDDGFTDFWNWLKGVGAAIENIVVSVADDIMVGIDFIVNGIKQVFKAIIQVIEDIVNAIGAFFLQLLKLIEELIEALSLLFHFGEIMWTHRWLAGQVNQRVTDLTTAITDTIVPNINAFFQQGEEAIAGFFDNLKAEFTTNGNPQLSNTRGYGQTPHTAFTITPQGGTPSSQATQCTWGTDKAKTGTPGATVTNPSALAAAQDAAPNATSADPISDFITAFIASLSTDPQLSKATTQLKADFNNLVQVNSASQFFSQLMVTLLDIIKTLVISALAVANALIDGLAKIIQDVINAVLDILNAEIEIPVLTWLYETLFGEKLTLLNIVTLVAAIPITLIFRLVEGQYPSQAGLPTYPTAMAAGTSGLRPNRVEAAPKPALIVFGVFVGICQLVQGIANCIGDGFGDEAPPAAGYVSLACGTLGEIFQFPLIGNDPGDVSQWDWAVYGIEVFEVLFSVFGVPDPTAGGTPNAPASTEFMSFGSLVLNLALFAVAVTEYVKDGKTDGISNTEFAETIIEAIVGAINPLKLDGEEAAGVVAAFDALGGIIEMFMSIFTAVISNASARPAARRLHFPFVAFNPQPAGAHPLRLAPALAGATP